MIHMNKLVLIGAGHSHLIAVEQLFKLGLANAEVTLISDVQEAPYSGMLSGYMAGIYEKNDLTIDLEALAKKFNVRLMIGKIVSIDPVGQKLLLSGGEEVTYDCLSINIGILPARISCSGEDQEKIIYVKPLSHFIPKWEKLLEEKKNLKISVVGGGSAGLEVTHALMLRGFKHVHLISSSDSLLPELGSATKDKAKQALTAKKVQLHLNSTAVSYAEGKLLLSTGASIECDYAFICTGAKAQRIKGLETDAEGYLVTNSQLQVQGFKNIFAAGDCINFNHQKLPKAGVYAVREGAILARNLFSALHSKELEEFLPQKIFLKIHLTGHKQALASKGRFYYQGKLAWLLKDYLDRSFMKRFKGM